jgi:putative Holliday junction resolvase
VGEAPGRTLAVDLGGARIGLALSDPTGVVVRPLDPLRAVGARRDVEALACLVQEEGVVRVVVGLPRSLEGDEGPAAAQARRFAARLRGRLPEVTVELWDEALTSVEAERWLRRRGIRAERRRASVDGAAAVLLLRDYLEARSVIGERTP